MKNKLLLAFVVLFACVLNAQDKSEFLKETFISKSDTLNYRILYPENFSESETYPLLLFLHGAGERGSDNESQLAHGSSQFLDSLTRKIYPAIVIFPQCKKDDYWANVDIDRSTKPLTINFKTGEKPTKSLDLVEKLLDSIKNQPFINKNQLYVGGLSMGGMGTYEMLYRNPNTFAAAFAICGAGDPATAKTYANNTPLWVFHGAQDDVVNPQYSVDMVTALLAAGAHPRFNLYDTANHNSWDSAFAEPDFLSWLFSKTLNQ
ncbi:MAG: alpha/beta hydrolase-fold protein [Leeuwenhoekiella sp.]